MALVSDDKVREQVFRRFDSALVLVKSWQIENVKVLAGLFKLLLELVDFVCSRKYAVFTVPCLPARGPCSGNFFLGIALNSCALSRQLVFFLYIIVYQVPVPHLARDGGAGAASKVNKLCRREESFSLSDSLR